MDTSGAFKMIRCINWASQHGQKTRNKILTDHFWDRQLFTRCGWLTAIVTRMLPANEDFRERPLPVFPRAQSLARHRL